MNLLFLQVDMAPELVDLAYKYGALPILIYAVFTLWKKVERHEKAIKDLNDEHKAEIRSNANELKQLNQNTLTVMSELVNLIKNNQRQ